jgi:suppressor of G2 allele of SKP1
MATSMELAPGDARFAKLAKELDDKAPPKAAAAPPAASEDQAAASSGKPKYKHDFYNGASEVVVTVFAKSVAAEHVSVDFGEQMLSVSVEAPYHLQPRLSGARSSRPSAATASSHRRSRCVSPRRMSK